MQRNISGIQPTNVCYFSTRCEWSKAFITELAQTPYKTEFRFINVDPGPQRQPLPQWLKKVPTLVIAGEPEPRTDADVMNWLYERKLRDGRSGHGLVANESSTGRSGTVESVEPVSFTFGQMGGVYDDAYSSVDNTEIQQLEHNFSYLGGSAASGTREGQQFQMKGNAAGGDHRSKKEQMFDAQMEAYQRERNSGMPQMIRRQ